MTSCPAGGLETVWYLSQIKPGSWGRAHHCSGTLSGILVKSPRAPCGGHCPAPSIHKGTRAQRGQAASWGHAAAKPRAGPGLPPRTLQPVTSSTAKEGGAGTEGLVPCDCFNKAPQAHALLPLGGQKSSDGGVGGASTWRLAEAASCLF